MSVDHMNLDFNDALQTYYSKTGRAREFWCEPRVG
jgi:hypothetical protein